MDRWVDGLRFVVNHANVIDEWVDDYNVALICLSVELYFNMT